MRSSPTHPTSRSACGSETVSRSSWPMSPPGSSAVAHAGRPGVDGRDRGGDGRGHARRWVPSGSRPGWGRTSAAAATRCRLTMRDEVAAVEPAAFACTTWGTPSVDIGAAVVAQLGASRLLIGQRVSALHPWSPRTSSPTGDKAPPRGGKPGSSSSGTGETIRRLPHDVEHDAEPRSPPGSGWSASEIAAAAVAAGRDPADITLVVVTKTFPASDIRLLADLGVRDVAENRHQDAAEKAAAAGRPRPGLALRRPGPVQQGGPDRGVRRRRPLRGHASGLPTGSAPVPSGIGGGRSLRWSR